MKSTPQMEQTLQEAALKGLLVSRTENNQYLKVSYKGAGKEISDKWNVKIYTSGSVVCDDMIVLESLVNGSFKGPDTTLKVLQIDDAGGGFPLCGVMIGIANEVEIATDTVDVKFFQSPLYEEKQYLREYTKAGMQLIKVMRATPQTHRVEICTGYINKELKDCLRLEGFDVRVTEIKGALQVCLEQLFKDYVQIETGKELGYDPKELKKKDLGRAYYKVLNWGKQNAPQLLKSGWGSM